VDFSALKARRITYTTFCFGGSKEQQGKLGQSGIYATAFKTTLRQQQALI
jgi:hypothetical protein